MRILVNEFCGHPFQIELSRELAQRGHTVMHVYFADNHSTPKGDTESGRSGSSNFVIEGLHVPMKFSKHSIRTRRRVDIAYGKAVASRAAAFRPDVVISANMPLDGQRILLDAAKLQNAKFIFWLQDIYSSAVRFVLKRKLGLLSTIAGAYYERVERKLLRSSDAVICIAPEFRRIAIAWGVESSHVHLIENWAPLDEVIPMDKDNAWSREHGLAGKFCFMYSGTLGMKHRPELLLELARHLETRADAKLVVIAGGAGSEWLRENATGVRKETLEILPFQPYNRLSEVLGASDVLIALLDSEAGAFAIPSKILSYLCAGRTLLVAAPTENHAAAIVKRANAGVVISSDCGSAIVDAAESLMESAELRNQYATCARAYAERSFGIENIAGQFLEVIANC